MRARELASDILQSISHPLRMTIIEALEAQSETFSGIMMSCGLNPNSDSGLFNYHLSQLVESEIVEKHGEAYRLTDLGRVVLKVLQTMKSECSSLLGKKEGGEYKEGRGTWKWVEIMPVEKPDLATEKTDCRLELSEVYWGVSLKTRGVDKVTALWPLSDGSVMYEMRDPACGGEGYTVLHLTDDGLYVVETVLEARRKGDNATLRTPLLEPQLVLPLPLRVGRRVEYESQTLQLSTNARVTGWRSVEGERRVEGEVVGQFKVSIDDKVFKCLLLREVIETRGVFTQEDGTREEYNPSIRVMMDRYLNENGRLRLEHLWYCQEGGRKSMARKEAKREAGPIFKETTYAGAQWFRVHQIELDEPRPEEAKAHI